MLPLMYSISLPPWLSSPLPVQPHPSPKEIPPPKPCPAFVEDIRHNCVSFSDDGADRLLRGHGNRLHAFISAYISSLLDLYKSIVPLFSLPPPPPLTVSLPPPGHTCHELFALRTGRIGRIPDFVVWAGMYVSFVHVCVLHMEGCGLLCR